MADETKRWQKDGAFCRWLIDAGYAYYDEKSNFKTHISDGLVIYMWEAWKASARDQGEGNG